MAILAALPAAAQLNTNLIVNGDAESGPAGTGVTTAVASIPNWTIVSGKPTVLPYNLTNTAAIQPTNGFIQLTDPAPPDHGFQYFAAVFPSNPAVLSQTVNISSQFTLINSGNAEFIASAYLGSEGTTGGTQMAVAFQNANGQTFNTVTVGPIIAPGPRSEALFLQQQIGIVPAGTTQVVVTLTLQNGNGDTGIADSLSFKLIQAGSSPALGHNLIVNPGAELGPNAVLPTPSLYIPGWSTHSNSGTVATSGSVAPYGGSGWIATTAPGPADRGTNLFCGLTGQSDLFQDIDVSAAASTIDAGQVTYAVSGWFGGPGPASLTYQFYDWAGNQLAPTAQLKGVTLPNYGLTEVENSGTLPAKTRRVRVEIDFPASDSLADDINFTLSAPGAPPVLTPGGVVSASAFGGFSTVAPGSWIEIYGDNLFSGAAQQWTQSQFVNGVAPTTVGGVTVSVGGAAAYIDYVSPNQVNALVPSNSAVGGSTVTLTNANGTSDNYPIYIAATEPGLLAPASFTIGGKQYVAALFPDGVTFALPANALPGVPSRPAQPGDVLTIYGVGFGPVTGGFTAGTIVTALNSLMAPVQFNFGGIAKVTPSYSGLAPNYTGLYQFNVTIPAGLPANGAEPFSYTLNGVAGPQTLYIAIQ